MKLGRFLASEWILAVILISRKGTSCPYTVHWFTDDGLRVFQFTCILASVQLLVASLRFCRSRLFPKSDWIKQTVLSILNGLMKKAGSKSFLPIVFPSSVSSMGWTLSDPLTNQIQLMVQFLKNHRLNINIMIFSSLSITATYCFAL